MSTAPVPPSSTPGKPVWLWWLLGFAGVAMAIVIVCALVLTSLVVKNVRLEEKNRRVQIRTPGGDVTLSATHKVKDVGLPIYPGATLTESGGSIQLTTPQDVRVGASGVHYHSAEAIEKVDAWYRARLGPEFKREGPHVRKAKVAVGSVEVNSDSITYSSDRDDGTSVVMLEKTAGGVNIVLVRLGKQEAQ